MFLFVTVILCGEKMGWSPGRVEERFWILKRDTRAPLCWEPGQCGEHRDSGVSLLRWGPWMRPEDQSPFLQERVAELFQTNLPASSFCFILFCNRTVAADMVERSRFVSFFLVCSGQAVNKLHFLLPSSIFWFFFQNIGKWRWWAVVLNDQQHAELCDRLQYS